MFACEGVAIENHSCEMSLYDGHGLSNISAL